MCSDCQCEIASHRNPPQALDETVVKKQFDGVDELIKALRLPGNAAESTRKHLENRIKEIADKQLNKYLTTIKLPEVQDPEPQEEPPLGIRDTLLGIRQIVEILLDKIRELEERV